MLSFSDVHTRFEEVYLLLESYLAEFLIMLK